MKGYAVRCIKLNELQAIVGADAIHDDVERVLFTRFNESIGFLTKGCRLLDFLDEQADDTTATAALDEVIACITAYIPQISLTQAQVTIDNNTLEIAIEFDYKGILYRDAFTYSK